MRERETALAVAVRVAYAAHALAQDQTWHEFGFFRLGDYCRERLDRSGRWFQDHAALGAGLVRLPVLADALVGRDGVAIGRVAATAIARVAQSETVATWVARARESSTRALLEEIRASAEYGGDGSGGRNSGADGTDDPAPCANESATPGREPPLHGQPSSGDLDDENEPKAEIVLRAPRPVRAALEEIFDLHRAVSAAEATLADFIAALAAESAAALPTADSAADGDRRAPDLSSSVLRQVEPTARIEHAPGSCHRSLAPIARNQSSRRRRLRVERRLGTVCRCPR